MKRLLLVFFLFPLYSFACDCETPPVAIEYLNSDYVFWGTVIKKEFTKDSITYRITFKIDKHFKKTNVNPTILTFTKNTESGLSSCATLNIKEGQHWLVFAYNIQGKWAFSHNCTNSGSYPDLDSINKKTFSLLERAEEIDIDKITFHRHILGSAYDDFQYPKPKRDLDSLLNKVALNNYPLLSRRHVERVVVEFDNAGNITNIFIPAEKLLSRTKEIYDITFFDYIPAESLTELQEELVKIIKQGGPWFPAIFYGRNVKAKIFLKVSYDLHPKPSVSSEY